MRLQNRLFFVVTVLVFVAIVQCFVTYYSKGISALRVTAEIWAVVIVLAGLLNLLLRRYRKSADNAEKGSRSQS